MKGCLLAMLAILLIAVVAALYWYSRPAPILTVTTWAGPYGRAQASALTRPYAAGIRVFLDSVRAYQDRQSRPAMTGPASLIHKPRARAAASTARFRAAMAGLAAKGLV